MSAATVRAIAVEAGDADVARLDDPVAHAAGLLVHDDDRISFRHALVHDAAYGLLTKAERRRLHGLAARRLEAEAVAEGRLLEAAAALARQFAAAEAHMPAARHARAAAERADADYAIDEAIALYAIAANSLRALVRAAGATPPEPLLRDLRATLDRQGFCLKMRGRVAESDAARDEAYALLPPGPSVERAVLLGHRSDNASARHDYDAEESLLLGAERTLDAIREPRDADWWHAWITIRSSRVGFAYWLDRTNEILPLLESLGGPVRDHGTAEQKAEYEHSWVMYLHRRDSFAPSAEVMAHVRAAYDADLASGRRDAIAWAEFMLGFSQLFSRDTQAAVEHLQLALAAGPRIGDDLLVARSATYLAFALRLARRFDAMGEVNERGLAYSRRLGIDQYVAIGLGNVACLRLRSGDAPGARDIASEGNAAWPDSPPNPLRMATIWPAIGADVALGDTAGAIGRLPALLAPGQWPPDLPVADALRTVLAADAADRHDLLVAALDRAREAGYL
jgi:hypothetical protein